MEILIIEDELMTARSLSKLIQMADPTIKVVGIIQSVEKSVSALNGTIQPDLIFMDVQLADGLCFEIFKQVRVEIPVIFCTAFNDYTMEAFKTNGVDYVLKPFSLETITAALKKVERLENYFQRNSSAPRELLEVISQLKPRSYKTSFLVFNKQKYQVVLTKQVAYFYIRNETTFLVTMEGSEYALLQNLEEIQNHLNKKDFFRLNRQYLIAFQAVNDVEHYFSRKLNVRLKVLLETKLLVGKDKTKAFLSWLGDR